jgi:hypothetical protein
MNHVARVQKRRRKQLFGTQLREDTPKMATPSFKWPATVNISVVIESSIVNYIINRHTVTEA